MSRRSIRIAFGLALVVALAWGLGPNVRAAATAAAKATALAMTGEATAAPAAASAVVPSRAATVAPAGEPEPIPSRSLAGVITDDAAAGQAAQGKTKPGKVTRDQLYPAKFQKLAPSEQKAAAKRAADLGLKPGVAGLALAAAGPLPGIEGPGGVPHYFGPYGNWAFSPMPSFGLLTDLTIVAGGSGYSATPTVTITDVYGTGVATATATVNTTAPTLPTDPPLGAITAIAVAAGSSGFHVPFVTISDLTGTGAEATAELDLTTITGGIPKFTDPLPGLWDPRGGGQPPAKAIPLGVPDVITYPGSDYYEIALREYEESFHSTLLPSRMRGYVQVNNGTDTTHLYDAATNPTGCVIVGPVPAGSRLCTAVEDNTIAPAPIRYLGPVIVAQGRVHGIQVDNAADPGDPRPVRVKFVNELPTGLGGNLFIPVDETVPGSGYGPAGPGGAGDKFTQNRATIHLHGNNTIWLSDGNTHQWITPAGETTPYPAGVSARNVPDMAGCASDPANPLLPGSSGCMTFYYTNAQSARLQFYHDHAHGITRLNVYAGEAGGYLVTDAVEQDLINGTNVTGVNVSKTTNNACTIAADDANQNGILDPGECAQVLPSIGTPLVIQDKTFVDAETVYAQDPTWNWGPTGVARTGDLWYPHVYMTVQNPWDLTGTNGYGRWHYGPWFNPPTPECINGGPVGCIEVGPVPNEYYQPVCDGLPDPVNTTCTAPWEPPMRPGVPNPSIPGESFMDTPIVNGTAYPFLDVPAGPVRFRILNAANDRFWNLQLYVAADKKTPTTPGTVGTVLCDGVSGVPVGDCTEVKMVPVGVAPANQYADTPSGIPDSTTKGPDWIQIGTEGGFMPKPNIVPPMPIGYNLDPAYFSFGVVNQHSLFLGSAERADVIVDFSQYAGKTLILYNDSPAPVPAGAAPYDNYTGDGDGVDGGGAPNTQPGYGPNTRTIMQFRVAGTAAPYDLAKLEAAWAKTGTKRGVFEVSQDPIIVPQAAYGSAYNNTGFPSNASQFILNVQEAQKTFKPIDQNGVLAASAVTIPLEMKAMHDEMGGVYDTMFGRMSGMLGLTNPNSPVHVLIPYGYSAPPTDIVKGSIEFTPIGSLADGTQIWRIFHNGVDTHPIHTHLFHAQLINRVGQDGQVTGGTVAVDPNDLGWKDTIKINPLEITFLALRPTVPTPDQLPFEVPDSVRLIDPGLPEGATLIPPAPAGWFDPLGNPLPDLTNHTVNFGWEYVWHCHILSHEEMDFMHALAFAVPPKAATITSAVVSGNSNNRVVTLTWLDNSIKEIGYRVERATDPTFTTGLTVYPSATGLVPVVVPTGGPANARTFRNTNVPDNRAYWYRVIAVGDTVGDTSPGLQNFPTMSADSPSNVWPVVVGTATATLPANPGPALGATVQVGPQVSLAWLDNATNETGFVVERCTVFAPATSCANFATIATAGPLAGTGNVTYLDTTVTPGNTYSYRVWAVNAIGRSALSTDVATATVAARPVAPIDFKVSVARSGGGQTPYTATLIWNWPDAGNGSNPTDFTLERATNLGFTQGRNSTPVAGGLRTVAQTRQLRANTVYYFRIRANNSAGSSAWTNALPFPIRTGQ